MIAEQLLHYFPLSWLKIKWHSVEAIHKGCFFYSILMLAFSTKITGEVRVCSVVCETEALKYEYSEWHNHIINSEIKAAFIQDLTFLVKALKAQNKDQIFGCVCARCLCLGLCTCTHQVLNCPTSNCVLPLGIKEQGLLSLPFTLHFCIFQSFLFSSSCPASLCLKHYGASKARDLST